MRATIMYSAGDVRTEDVPDPSLVEPTDAVVAALRSSSRCSRAIDGKRKWRRAGSNSRPRDYETLALAN